MRVLFLLAIPFLVTVFPLAGVIVVVFPLAGVIVVILDLGAVFLLPLLPDSLYLLIEAIFSFSPLAAFVAKRIILGNSRVSG